MTIALRSDAIVPGAVYVGDGKTRFTIWAPERDEVSVHIISPDEREVRLDRIDRGYHVATIDAAEPGTLYKIRLGDDELPDPASRSQPEGVHGPSEVVDLRYEWTDGEWRGIELPDYVIYELHVGAYSPDGTFAGLISRLDSLKDLGVTAIEIMPVAQFPGERNWGYDGVGIYAPQNSYGGPHGLQQLVDAAHTRGLAVILDVVYNHFGAEGNYMARFAPPFFTDRYQIYWGDAINFDGPDSDEVRRYYIENALMWIRDYHIDALRLDAVHAIFDQSANPFLRELADAVHAEGDRLNRTVHLIAESDLSDPKVVRPSSEGGFGMDAEWNDDFHHALHALLTGERDGYYSDYGSVTQLAQCYRRAYALAGEYSVFRRRRHGVPPVGVSGARFVGCAQNHDQTGNRMLGERLSVLVEFEALKLAAAAVILSPFTPLLFMGEEYGEEAPFLFFVDHSDEALLAGVNEGRVKEFEAFGWNDKPPEPGDPATFERSRPHPEQGESGRGAVLRSFYKELLRLRRELPALHSRDLADIEVREDEGSQTVVVLRRNADDRALLTMNFGELPATISIEGNWQPIIHSADRQWSGPGSAGGTPQRSNGEITLAPLSAALYVGD